MFVRAYNELRFHIIRYSPDISHVHVREELELHRGIKPAHAYAVEYQVLREMDTRRRIDCEWSTGNVNGASPTSAVNRPEKEAARESLYVTHVHAHRRDGRSAKDSNASPRLGIAADVKPRRVLATSRSAPHARMARASSRRVAWIKKQREREKGREGDL